MKLGFISDVHEDIGSLRKALKLLDKQQCDKIVCLGDLTGCPAHLAPYRKTRNAAEVLRIVLQVCSVVIAGNHDLFAARKTPSSRFGFEYPDDWYEKDLAEREQIAEGLIWTYEREELPTFLREEELAEIRSWPEWMMLEENGVRILLSHYLHPDLTGSSNILPPDKTLAGSHLKHMEEIDVKVSFFGHLHPEGSWWISEGMNRLVNWGHLELPDRTTAIGVPAICRGANRNGVMIFDTVSNEINTMKIPRLG